MKTKLLFPTFSVLVTSAIICVAAESKRVEREVRFTSAHYSISEVDDRPVATLTSKPVYPAHLRPDKVRGEVVIGLIVSVEGIPIEVQYRLATDEAFIESAIECVKKWRFKPAKKQGESVPCSMYVPLIFQTDEKSG